jgi:CheY-like chemotaxis protein
LKSGIRYTIIAITAHAMAGDEEKNIATGMEEHVTKRIDPDELVASL